MCTTWYAHANTCSTWTLTPLPFLLSSSSSPSTPYQSAHTYTHSDMLRLYSPATSSGKTRQLLQWALPNSPPISFLICRLAWSAATYWPEMTPLCPVDLDVLCEHLLECLLSFHPSNSIQQLLNPGKSGLTLCLPPGPNGCLDYVRMSECYKGAITCQHISVSAHFTVNNSDQAALGG